MTKRPVTSGSIETGYSTMYTSRRSQKTLRCSNVNSHCWWRQWDLPLLRSPPPPRGLWRRLIVSEELRRSSHSLLTLKLASKCLPRVLHLPKHVKVSISSCMWKVKYRFFSKYVANATILKILTEVTTKDIKTKYSPELELQMKETMTSDRPPYSTCL